MNDDILMLIIGRLKGISSAADEAHLEQWLSENPDHLTEYEKVKKLWEGSGQAAFKPIDVSSEWEKFRNRHFAKTSEPKIRQLQFSQVLRYAAVAVIFIGLAVAALYYTGSKTYKTGTGERLQVNLADGSQVILGENSQLSVPHTFNWQKRFVKLNGEGFFEVAHNPQKTFQIDGPLTSTKDIGTSFKLIATLTKNQVEVTDGKVAYWSYASSDTLILSHGKKGVLQYEKLEETQIDKPAFDSWKTGVFVFENEKVTNVLRSLQNYYVFNIDHLEKYNDLNCRFSGKFSHQNLKEVLNELSLTMGMEYTLEGKTLYITKFYCE